MDTDRIAGSVRVVAGRAKVAVGTVHGDAKPQADGHAQRAEGAVQNALGGIEDERPWSWNRPDRDPNHKLPA
jgi:uncharacterized protein YjbJ (UPF0337 family)